MVGIGHRALYSNFTGSSNVVLGNNSMFNNNSGWYNVSIGHRTMVNTVSGEKNVVVHLDVYHMNIEEQDLVSPVLVAGSKLGYVHIGAEQPDIC